MISIHAVTFEEEVEMVQRSHPRVMRCIVQAAQIEELRRWANKWEPGCGEHGPQCAHASELRERITEIEGAFEELRGWWDGGVR